MTNTIRKQVNYLTLSSVLSHLNETENGLVSKNETQYFDTKTLSKHEIKLLLDAHVPLC